MAEANKHLRKVSFYSKMHMVQLCAAHVHTHDVHVSGPHLGAGGEHSPPLQIFCLPNLVCQHIHTLRVPER